MWYFNVLCSGNMGYCHVIPASLNVPSESITTSPPPPATVSVLSHFTLRCYHYKLLVLETYYRKGYWNYTVRFSAVLNTFRTFLDWHGELQSWSALLSPNSGTSKSFRKSHILREKALSVSSPHTGGTEFAFMGACIPFKVFIMLKCSFCKGSPQWFPKGNFITVNEKSLSKGIFSQLKY